MRFPEAFDWIGFGLAFCLIGLGLLMAGLGVQLFRGCIQ